MCRVLGTMRLDFCLVGGDFGDGELSFDDDDEVLTNFVLRVSI